MIRIIKTFYDNCLYWQRIFISFLIGIISLSTIFNIIKIINSTKPNDIFWKISDSLSINNIIYNYQSLIAALIALIGAFYTIKTMQKQINLSKDLALEARKRKLKASIAASPIALSNICQYAIDCGYAASQFLDSQDQCGAISHEQINSVSGSLKIQLPLEAIDTIKEIIEHDEKNIIQLSAKIVSTCQIIDARFNNIRLASKNHTIISIHNIENRIIDCAELHALASSLFEYGRTIGEIEPESHKLLLKNSLNSVLAKDKIGHYEKLQSYIQAPN